MCPNLSLVGFPAKWQEEFVYTRSWRLKGKVCLFCNMFRSLSYRCQASSEWYNMWKSTRSKTKSESELSESESELSWLLICSAPSCWNWHPPLLFTLFSLKVIGGHKPHLKLSTELQLQLVRFGTFLYFMMSLVHFGHFWSKGPQIGSDLPNALVLVFLYLTFHLKFGFKSFKSITQI